MGPGSAFAVAHLSGTTRVRASRCNFQTADTRPHCRGATRPSFAYSTPSKTKRAQGKPGARCTRGLVCNRVEVGGTRAYRFSGGIRLSLRSGLRIIPRSPRRALHFCRRCPREVLLPANVTPALGVSGPHVFTVRSNCARQSQLPRPPHPTARS